MANEKEFREFYLRDIVVTSGSKADQEAGFPVKYNINTKDGIKTVFNRLLKGHYPSENVMRKLLESITFKLNPEDVASLIQQGLVKLADDDKVISRDDTDNNNSTDFKTIVVPHQLPEVVLAIDGLTDIALAVSQTVGGITIRPYKRTISGSARLIYLLTVAAVVIPPASTYFTTGMIMMWSGAIGSIPSGWLLCNGTSGTPNLSGKFIVGYDSGDPDYNVIGNNGGAKTVILDKTNLPQHYHKILYPLSSQPVVTPPEELLTMGDSGTPALNFDNVTSGVTDATGNTYALSQPFDKRPPYYTLAYIMKS